MRFAEGSKRWTIRVLVCVAWVLMEASSAVAEPIGAPPYSVMYTSDTTHILSTYSPYHTRSNRGRLSEAMFRAAVDEVADAGVDALLLQPGLGWVPWWPGEVVPLDEHRAWFKSHYGHDGHNAFFNYVEAGNDYVRTMIDRAHERDMDVVISYRLNDLHHLELAMDPNNTRIGETAQFYVDNPQYQIGVAPNQPTSAHRRAHNWAFQEAREYKFRLIEELAQDYPIDGLELDFMRHTSYFHLGQTNSAQRRTIMSGFIGDVRQMLDGTTSLGDHRWLSLRIPGEVEAHDAMGLDAASFGDLGVNMVTITNFAQYAQQMDLGQIRQQLDPNVALYVEMFDNTAVTRAADNSRWLFRKTTPEQMTTGAHLAYSRGADGVALFNMQYYRENVNPVLNQDGPFTEPPFGTIERLRDRVWLARQPQHYFLGSIWDDPRTNNRPLPTTVAAGQTASFTLDLAPPTDGWQLDGKLRVQSLDPIADRPWTAWINGVELVMTDDVSEPYPNVYTHLLLTPEHHRAWVVPHELLVDGFNEIEIELLGGAPAELFYLDLAMPTPRLHGDANGDGQVDAFDLGIWQTQFGQTGQSLAADFDGDGDVDAFDLGVWQASFGTGSAVVPEPAVSLLGLVAVLAANGKRPSSVTGMALDPPPVPKRSTTRKAVNRSHVVTR